MILFIKLILLLSLAPSLFQLINATFRVLQDQCIISNLFVLLVQDRQQNLHGLLLPILQALLLPPRFKIYWKSGHYAFDCWHRYDHLSASQIFDNNSQFAPLSSDNDEPSILGSSPTTHDSLWYPDSRVSHHFTYDDTTLTAKTPYT